MEEGSLTGWRHIIESSGKISFALCGTFKLLQFAGPFGDVTFA